MKNFKNKVMVLALSFAFITPSLSHASDVVMYDDINLDNIFVKEGIDYDKSAVEDRKAEYEANPDINIAPDYEVKDVTIVEDLDVDEDGNVKVVEKEETIIEDKKPAPIYHKTAVYDRVVDISEHQDPNKIDYDKFADDIDGAILRTSITDADTLNIRKDYKLEDHYKNLNARGVPLGYYHYSRATNAKEAIREAEFVTSVIRGKNVSLPVYIDIEDDKRQAKSTIGNISAAAEAFVMAMERNGYVAGIYSYPWFANKYLTKDVRNNNEFWIADYTSKGITNYNESDFDSWQYAHTGKINGYSGNIDINALYKDYPLIINGKSYKPIDELVDEILSGKWGVGTDRQKRLAYAGYDYTEVQAAVNSRLARK